MSDSYPLAAYAGARPPAPEWFDTALETQAIAREVMVDGVPISYRQWGSADKPGLLLVHGMAAHANWYDFFAPDFAAAFNVVAMSFSGMGGSGHRDIYTTAQFSADQIAVMQDSGMFAHAENPIIIGHSYGGLMSLATAGRIGAQLRGVVTIDTPIFPPEVDLEGRRPKASNREVIFADEKTALGRFRLVPEQPCENHYILDHIARHSIKPIEHNGVSGWTWKMDPQLWEKTAEIEKGVWALLPDMACEIAFLRGENSVLVTEAVRDAMLEQVQAPFVTIKNAGHHVFLDNPRDTISELQKICAAWGTPV